MKGFACNRWAWHSEANRPAEDKTVDTFCAEAGAAGYDAIEALGPGMDEAAERHGLTRCGAYAGAPLHLPWDACDVDAKLLVPAREIAALGGDFLAVNIDPKGSWNARERKTGDEIKRQGENLSRLGKEIEPLGLRVVVHNHANTYDLHMDDIQSVAEHADEAVGVMLDTGWALTSGDDPVERARALGPRLAALHLRNQRGDVPTEWLGDGDMDVAAFIAVLKDIEYDGWLETELWHRADVAVTRSLLEDQRMTVELLRDLWGE